MKQNKYILMLTLIATTTLFGAASSSESENGAFFPHLSLKQHSALATAKAILDGQIQCDNEQKSPTVPAFMPQIATECYFLTTYNPLYSQKDLPDYLKKYFKGVTIQESIDHRNTSHPIGCGIQMNYYDITINVENIKSLEGLNKIKGAQNIQKILFRDVKLKNHRFKAFRTVQPNTFYTKASQKSFLFLLAVELGLENDVCELFKRYKIDLNMRNSNHLSAYLSNNSYYFMLTADYNKTALMLAAEKGYAEVVRVLIDAGADIEKRTDNDNRTALMLAAARGHSEVVRALIDAGAGDRESAFLIAIHANHEEIANMLMPGYRYQDMIVIGTSSIIGVAIGVTIAVGAAIILKKLWPNSR